MLSLPRPREVAIVVLAAAVYLLAAKLGLRLASIHPSATPVWPPTGIALAAFLLAGYHVWPGIFAAAFLSNLTTAGTVWTSLAIGAGNTLEGVAAAWLVRRFANGIAAFDRPADVFKFAFLAAGLSTTISPTIGVTSLAAGGFATWRAYWPVWCTWWLGDAGGALIVAPFIILWSRVPALRWDRRALVERALFLAALLPVAISVFGGGRVFPYFLVPFIIWAAFRFGPREAVSVVVLIGAIALWGTTRVRGTLAAATSNESLLLLQAFLGIMMMVALPVASVVAERQRLHDAERDARRTAEEAAGRAARLQTVTAELARAVGTEDVARVVVQHGIEILGAQAGGLVLVTAEGAALRAVCDIGFNGALMQHWRRVPLSMPTLVADAARSGTPMFLDDGVSQDLRLQRAWQTLGVRAQAAIPLMIGERAIGVVMFAFTSPRVHNPEDREFMLALANVCAQALERAQLYDRERHVAETLQQAFLPAAIPQVLGMRIDVAYLPGTQEAQVGGDWYDVFQLSDGRIGVSIGDVVGHGLAAAVVMGQLRQAMRTAATGDAEPAAVLDRAHELLAMGADTEAMATAIFGVYDPVPLTFTYAAAGHPFGVMCSKEGAIEPLPWGEGPLGIDGYGPRTTRRLALAPGALLVLYTDGLLDMAQNIPGEEVILHRVVRQVAGEGGGEQAHRILERMLQGRPATDDIAVITLAVQAVGADRVELTLSADPRSVRQAREAVRLFTARLGLTDSQGRRLGVALSEAVSNAVEHAYGATVGPVRVRAWRDGAWLRVEVEDDGQWRTPRPEEQRGYGIPTMRALVDSVDIERLPSGTVVRMALSLANRRVELEPGGKRPATDAARGPAAVLPLPALDDRLASSDAAPSETGLDVPVTAAAEGTEPSPPEALDIPAASTGPFQVGTVRGIPIVEVAGDVDLSNAHMLQAALEQAAQTDQPTVVVSLGGSAYFDSQGMHMLLRFNRRLETSRRQLVVVVPWHHPLKAVLDALGGAVNLKIVQTVAEALATAN